MLKKAISAGRKAKKGLLCRISHKETVDQKYKTKKKSNNMHYEGKENQNCNIIGTNDVTNNSILKEILQRLDNIERRHIGAIAPNRS